MKTVLISYYHWLWDKDPGFIHLQHASRTLVAMLLTITMLWPASLLLKVYGCFACTFVMQGIMGYKPSQERQNILFAMLANLIAFIAASWVKQYFLATAIYLISSSFMVFYVRRFGPRFTIFPVFAWLMGFLVTILPGQTTLISFFTQGTAVLLGLIVAYVVYFHLMPQNKYKLFLQHCRDHIQYGSVILRWLANSLKQSSSVSLFEQQHMQYREKYRRLFLFNQNILESTNHYRIDAQQRLGQLMVSQYMIGRTILMLMESVEEMLIDKISLSDNCLAKLVAIMTSIAGQQQKLFVNFETGMVTQTLPMDGFDEDIKALRVKIVNEHGLAHDSMIYLYNLLLSLQSLHKHLIGITRVT